MIESAFYFETGFTESDFAKIGRLLVRWAQIEHVLGNCLRVLLGLSLEEAKTKVFKDGGAERVKRIGKHIEENPLTPSAQVAFDELRPVLEGLRFVRNTIAHCVVLEGDDGKFSFELRSRGHTLTMEQVLSTEELTNYAGHLVYAFRYALGFKEEIYGHECPTRPPIPEFLRGLIQFEAANAPVELTG
jgi:hypothetical protein